MRPDLRFCGLNDLNNQQRWIYLSYHGTDCTKYPKNITEFPSFPQHHDALIEPKRIQLVENGQYGGRFIPRSVVDSRNDDLTAAMHSVTEDRVVFCESRIECVLGCGGE